MGCGQSKINIYPRKSKGKHSSKKSGGGANGARLNGDASCDGDETPPAGAQNAAEDATADAGDGDACSAASDGDASTKVKLKPQVGGPLLANTEISDSQLNFFRMLDEKIESGRDYDSNSETELSKENERLNSLLQDWETASAASRSLPSTPRHRIHSQRPTTTPTGGPLSHPAIVAKHHHTNIPQSVIHQSYGVTPKPTHSGGVHSPPFTTHQPPLSAHIQVASFSKVPPGVQYQDNVSQNPQIKQNLSQFVAQRQYQISQSQQRDANVLQNYQIYNNPPMVGSPIHKHSHIPQHTVGGTYSPPLNHSPLHYKTQPIATMPPRIGGNPPPGFPNGEFMLQQQIYNQQLQYQQSKEIQQYKQSREQLLLQQQQIVVQAHTMPQPHLSYQPNKQQSRVNHTSHNLPQPQYQTSVEIPIRTGVGLTRQMSTPEVLSPKLMYRKQTTRQYSHELT